MSTVVVEDDLSDGSIELLLQEHLDEMRKYSPPESIHALDSSELKHSSITFWSARINNELVGCGALKELSANAGELKSMRTATGHKRKGIAQKILSKIISEAADRGYSEIKLETGSDSMFDPAVALYKKHGFKECGPFGSYIEDPYSRFLELKLLKKT